MTALGLVASLQRMAGKRNRLYSSRFLAAINRQSLCNDMVGFSQWSPARVEFLAGDTNWPY
jgi:hypothetical protein